MKRFLAALLVLATPSRMARGQDDTPPPPPTPAGVEVLTRGPVHEAFAEPVVFDPRPGVVVPKAPPEPIDEMPPDQKPQGEAVAWIGGYWAWDDERDDFLWVSGIWRDIPPGRQWVPGYWNAMESGHQWVNGYWAAEQQAEAEYLPQPPNTLEAGPNTPAPSSEHAWAPGCWWWRGGRFLWRPGYWFAVRPNWVWVPAHYVCTPGGYLFVDGYWDYVVARRGLLFAPVYVPPAVIVQPAFVYTPMVVIQEPVLVEHLWCRPSYGFYYFGDYYAPSYAQSGFSFWLSFGRSRVGYDPIFVQQSYVRQRVDVAWETHVREVYRERVGNVAARPPHTYAAQREWASARHDLARDLRVGAPLAEVARARADVVHSRADMVASRAAAVESRHDLARARLEQVGETRRSQIAARSQALRDFQQQRQQREAQIAARTQQAGEHRAAIRSEAQQRAGNVRAERLATNRREGVNRGVAQPRSPIASPARTPRQVPPTAEGRRPLQSPPSRPEAPLRPARADHPQPSRESASRAAPHRAPPPAALPHPAAGRPAPYQPQRAGAASRPQPGGPPPGPPPAHRPAPRKPGAAHGPHAR